jgi:pyruvyltransferase
MSLVYELSQKLSKAKNRTKAKVLGNGISAFWWRGKKNFGDLLTPELVNHYGYTPIHSEVIDAKVVGVGSLMHMIPKNYTGTILGTGIINSEVIRLENATFAAVRGELSKKSLGLAQDTPTGDLGLLAKILLSENCTPKKFAVGLIPHFVDKSHPWIEHIMHFLGSKGCVIEVQDSAKNVINQVSQCELIVSSSLHGIIVSVALGIPNVWMKLSDEVIGDGFKFRDYNSSINYDQTPLKVTSSSTFKDIELNISNKSANLVAQKTTELEIILKNVLLKSKN